MLRMALAFGSRGRVAATVRDKWEDIFTSSVRSLMTKDTLFKAITALRTEKNLGGPGVPSLSLASLPKSAKRPQYKWYE